MSTESPASLEEALLELPEDEIPSPDAGDASQVADESLDDEAPADPEAAEGDEPPDDEPAAGSIFDLAAEEGIDLSGYRDEKEAIRSLLNAKKLVGQRNELAEWGRLLNEKPEEVYRVLGEHLGRTTKPAEAAAPPVEAPEAAADDADVAAYMKLRKEEPAWDDDWENQITVNEKGQTVPAEDAEPNVLRKIAAHRRWEQKVAKYVVKYPEVIVKAAGSKLTAGANEEIKKLRDQVSQMQQQNVQQEAQRFLLSVASENREWMFNGGEIRAGNLSPAGQLFQQHFDRLLQENPNTKNPRAFVDAARALVIAELNARNAAAARKQPAGTEGEPPADGLRTGLQGIKKGKTRTSPLSASATGRGVGQRGWPKVNGRDMTLTERLMQIAGKE